MKKNRHFLLLLALLCIAMLCLAGCGKDPAQQQQQDPFVYVPNYAPMEQSTMMDVGAFFQVGDYLFMNSYGPIGVRSEENSDLRPLTPEEEEMIAKGDDTIQLGEGEWVEYGHCLFRCNLDGSDLQRLSGFTPYRPDDLPNVSSYIRSFSAGGDDTLCVTEDVSWYEENDPDNYEDDEWGTDYYLTITDLDGNVKLRTNISQLLDVDPQNFYLNSLVMDGEGNAYFTAGQTLYAIDSNGQQIAQIEHSSWLERLCITASGDVLVTVYEENGQALRPVDLQNQELGESIPMPMNTYNTYEGSGEWDLMVGGNDNLYGYKESDGSFTRILNWLNSDVDGNYISNVIALDNGNLLSLYRDYEANENYLLTMVKTPSDQVEPKTVLTLACMYTDYGIRSEVLKFNRSNPNYRIQIKDYSEYNTPDDYTAGLTKLNTEIVSGLVPDLLDMTSLPYQQYVAKGVLEDLWPYIDADAEVGRDALMTEALQAMCVDGGLYEITPSFGVLTAIGQASKIGPEPGWTAADLQAAAAKYPNDLLFQGFTRMEILRNCLYFNTDSYIDWQAGEAHFDTPEFISLLEFAKSFPEEIDWETYEYQDEISMMVQGKCLLVMGSLYSFEEVMLYNSALNGDLVYKGFPSQNGIGASLFPTTALAITTTCADKDAAWSFMRTFLTEESQNASYYYGFPTNRAVFNEMAENAMKEQSDDGMLDGGGVVMPYAARDYWLPDGTTMEIKPLTQAQLDDFLSMVSQVSGIAGSNDQILNIVEEEATMFFAGQRSAQDTAGAIQNRVNLYVKEQR